MRLRSILSAAYLAVLFAIVFAFYFDDWACRRPGSHSYFLMIAELSLALAVWDFLVGALAATTLFRTDSDFEWLWLRSLTTTVLTASGFVYLPFWIYRGHGVFRFHDTWADISCFFTGDENVLPFLFFLVPIFALSTFLRELAFVRLAGRSVRPEAVKRT